MAPDMEWVARLVDKRQPDCRSNPTSAYDPDPSIRCPRGHGLIDGAAHEPVEPLRKRPDIARLLTIGDPRLIQQ